MLSTALLLSFLSPGSFPNYDNPITANPPLAVPSSAAACEVVLFRNASLSGYGQVEQRPYAGPPACGGGADWGAPYAKVVLEFRGAVRGVQFDRYGALWLGGVELLRTTTPEPSPAGIEWVVSKDVTRFAQLFRTATPASANASLSIPNVVDSTYTGVLYVDAKLTFYAGAGSSAAPAATAAAAARSSLLLATAEPTVLPLWNPPAAAGGPWSVTGLAGNASHAFALGPLPHRDVVGLSLEVGASGHGCEEFWYTNVPAAFAAAHPAAQLCAGGAYRQLRVRVDGLLAGAAFPYPVVYTGGINPLLWRPLTGLLSFDVAAYRFDLTPWLGLLLDGAAHTLELDVVSDSSGAGSGGVWYLDPVLLLRRDPVGGARLGRMLEHAGGIAPVVRTTTHNESGSGAVSFRTQGDAELRVTGQVVPAAEAEGGLASTLTVTTSTKTTLTSINANELKGEGFSAAVTSGTLKAQTQTTTETAGQPPITRTSGLEYPYAVTMRTLQNNGSFQIEAQVQFARQRHEQWEGLVAGSSHGAGAAEVAWSNGINASAVYNRSTDAARTMNVQQSDSAESFTITVTAAAAAAAAVAEAAGAARAAAGSPPPCYDRALTASNGSVTSDSGAAAFTCAFPANATWCGANLCPDTTAAVLGSDGGATVLLLVPAEKQAAAEPRAHASAGGDAAAALPYRLPRTMGASLD
jgi:hypothetical protein